MEEDYRQTVKQHHQLVLPSGETVKVEGGHVVLPGTNQSVPLGTYHGAVKESYGWETAEHYNQKFKKLKKGRHSSFDRIREEKKAERKRLPQLMYRRGEGSIRDPTGDNRAKHASLLSWAQRVTAGYPGVNVRNLSSSWRDGLAFNSVLHRYRPNSVNWRKISSPSRSNKDRLRVAFDLAEKEFGVKKTLEPSEVDVEEHNDTAKGKMVSYISSLREALPEEAQEYAKYEIHMNDYNRQAREWLIWVKRSTQEMKEVPHSLNLYDIKRLLSDLDMFRAVDLDRAAQTKQRLADMFAEFEDLFGGTGQLLVENDLSTPFLDKAWSDLLRATDERDQLLRKQLDMHETLDELARRVQYNIGTSTDKLTLVQHHVKGLESRFARISSQEITDALEHIFRELKSLDKPIQQLYADTEKLKTGGHPRAEDLHKQVLDLDKRRSEMLLSLESNQQTMIMKRLNEEAYKGIRKDIFQSCEECIAWIKMKLNDLSSMKFSEDLKILEPLLEKQKKENRNIEDFRAQVDNCISRNAEVTSKDDSIYSELLSTLESDYQQLRDLSAGRVLDLDSVVAFVRAAQTELGWVEAEAQPEVERDWSDISSLNVPSLQKHYKRLLEDIEHREDAYFNVYDQGVKAANYGHPAVRVIEKLLNSMQIQWDWLLSLANCFEIHLQDANNLKRVLQFLEEAQSCEQWIQEQRFFLETRITAHDFTNEQTKQAFKDLQDMQKVMSHYENVLHHLLEKCRTSSPLWQRNELIRKPISLQTLSDYIDSAVTLHKGYEVRLLDNSNHAFWSIEPYEGRTAQVPSVIFRIPPPDIRLFEFMKKLQNNLDSLRHLLQNKEKSLKINLIRNGMMEIKKWNLETFSRLDPSDTERTIKELNADTNFVLEELHPDDRIGPTLKAELKETNDHFYGLLQLSKEGPGSDLSKEFDQKLKALVTFLENARNKLQHRIRQPLPQDSRSLIHTLHEHKEFEDVLQSCDTEVATVKELFQQLTESTHQQKAGMERLLVQWKDVWDLSKLHVQTLKSAEHVVNCLTDVLMVIEKHERYLTSFESMPSKIDRLRTIHSQLLELNLTLKQQQPLADDLRRSVQVLLKNIGQSDSKVIESRAKDALDSWTSICSQIQETLVSVESAIQQLMVYKPDYESEMSWLDRVEMMVQSVNRGQTHPGNQHQSQIDLLNAELLGLTAHGISIDAVTKRGHTFVKEAQQYDRRLDEYRRKLGMKVPEGGSIRRRSYGSPSPSSVGAYQVFMELEELHRKFQLIQTYGKNSTQAEIAKEMKLEEPDYPSQQHLEMKGAGISGVLEARKSYELQAEKERQQLTEERIRLQEENEIRRARHDEATRRRNHKKQELEETAAEETLKSKENGLLTETRRKFKEQEETRALERARLEEEKRRIGAEGPGKGKKEQMRQRMQQQKEAEQLRIATEEEERQRIRRIQEEEEAARQRAVAEAEALEKEQRWQRLYEQQQAEQLRIAAEEEEKQRIKRIQEEEEAAMLKAAAEAKEFEEQQRRRRLQEEEAEKLRIIVEEEQRQRIRRIQEEEEAARQRAVAEAEALEEEHRRQRLYEQQQAEQLRIAAEEEEKQRIKRIQEEEEAAMLKAAAEAKEFEEQQRRRRLQEEEAEKLRIIAEEEERQRIRRIQEEEEAARQRAVAEAEALEEEQRRQRLYEQQQAEQLRIAAEEEEKQRIKRIQEEEEAAMLKAAAEAKEFEEQQRRRRLQEEEAEKLRIIAEEEERQRIRRIQEEEEAARQRAVAEAEALEEEQRRQRLYEQQQAEQLRIAAEEEEKQRIKRIQEEEEAAMLKAAAEAKEFEEQQRRRRLQEEEAEKLRIIAEEEERQRIRRIQEEEEAARQRAVAEAEALEEEQRRQRLYEQQQAEQQQAEQLRIAAEEEEKQRIKRIQEEEEAAMLKAAAKAKEFEEQQRRQRLQEEEAEKLRIIAEEEERQRIRRIQEEEEAARQRAVAEAEALEEEQRRQRLYEQQQAEQLRIAAEEEEKQRIKRIQEEEEAAMLKAAAEAKEFEEQQRRRRLQEEEAEKLRIIAEEEERQRIRRIQKEEEAARQRAVAEAEALEEEQRRQRLYEQQQAEQLRIAAEEEEKQRIKRIQEEEEAAMLKAVAEAKEFEEQQRRRRLQEEEAEKLRIIAEEEESQRIRRIQEEEEAARQRAVAEAEALEEEQRWQRLYEQQQAEQLRITAEEDEKQKIKRIQEEEEGARLRAEEGEAEKRRIIAEEEERQRIRRIQEDEEAARRRAVAEAEAWLYEQEQEEHLRIAAEQEEKHRIKIINQEEEPTIKQRDVAEAEGIDEKYRSQEAEKLRIIAEEQKRHRIRSIQVEEEAARQRAVVEAEALEEAQRRQRLYEQEQEEQLRIAAEEEEKQRIKRIQEEEEVERRIAAIAAEALEEEQRRQRLQEQHVEERLRIVAEEEERQRIKRIREEEEAARRRAVAETEALEELQRRQRLHEQEQEEIMRIAAEEQEKQKIKRVQHAEEVARLNAASEAEASEEAQRRQRIQEQTAEQKRRAIEEQEAARKRVMEAEKRRILKQEDEERRRALVQAETRRKQKENEKIRQEEKFDTILTSGAEVEERERDMAIEQFRKRRAEQEKKEADARKLAFEAARIHEAEKRFVRGRGQDIIEISISEEKFYKQQVMEQYPSVEPISPKEYRAQTDEEFIPHITLLELEAVKLGEAEEALSVTAAMENGVLDFRCHGAEFYNKKTDSRLSFEGATRLGYVTQPFYAFLNTYYGIHDPDTGDSLRLLQAIQRKLYDPCTQSIIDYTTGEPLDLYEGVSRGIISVASLPQLIQDGVIRVPPIPLEQAISQGSVNSESGVFKSEYFAEIMPLKVALSCGYISASYYRKPMLALSLTDCIEMGFINTNSGIFEDVVSGQYFTLQEAVSRRNEDNLINLNIPEVINTAKPEKVTVAEAVLSNILNTATGLFFDIRAERHITLQEAYDRGFICKPQTLLEATASLKLDHLGRYNDDATTNRMTFLEAIAWGFLDTDAKHIVDPVKKDTISITTALERGLLLPDGRFCHPETRFISSVQRAIDLGWVVPRIRLSVFEIRAFKDTLQGKTLSFFEAVEAGVINLKKQIIINTYSRKHCSIGAAARKNLVEPLVQRILTEPLLQRASQEKPMNIFEAICSGVIDPHKRCIFDGGSDQPFSPKQAFDSGLLCLRAAVHMAAAFDVDPLLVMESLPSKPEELRRLRSRPSGQSPKGIIPPPQMSPKYDVLTSSGSTTPSTSPGYETPRKFRHPPESPEMIGTLVASHGGGYSQTMPEENTQFETLDTYPQPDQFASQEQIGTVVASLGVPESKDFSQRYDSGDTRFPEHSPPGQKSSKSKVKVLKRVFSNSKKHQVKEPNGAADESHPHYEKPPKHGVSKVLSDIKHVIYPKKPDSPSPKMRTRSPPKDASHSPKPRATTKVITPPTKHRDRIILPSVEEPVLILSTQPESDLQAASFSTEYSIADTREEESPDFLFISSSPRPASRAELETFNESRPQRSPDRRHRTITPTTVDRREQERKRLRMLIDNPHDLAHKQKEFIRKLIQIQFPADDPLLKNPVSGRQMTTREAVESGFFDVRTGELVHPMSGRRYNMPKAVRMKSVSLETAIVFHQTLGLPIDELEAIDRNPVELLH